jgi:hypothetical protein
MRNAGEKLEVRSMSGHEHEDELDTERAVLRSEQDLTQTLADGLEKVAVGVREGLHEIAQAILRAAKG